MSKYAVLNSFYSSKKWADLRLSLINQRGNRCEHCGNIIPKSIKLIAHHKIELTPENCLDANISLNPDNISIICFDCHQKIHNRFGHQPSRNVYLVYGPPLSGKSSFVQERMTRGDLIVDMDRLYQAVSMLPYFDKPDNLMPNIWGIYNQLIDHIKTRYGRWNNAWVIGGFADKYKREKLANDLGAELIFCNVSQEECLRRLEIDEERRYRKDEWKTFIERWFTTYTA